MDLFASLLLAVVIIIPIFCIGLYFIQSDKFYKWRYPHADAVEQAMREAYRNGEDIDDAMVKTYHALNSNTGK